MTSPGHFIIAGTKVNEGVILSRTHDIVSRKVSLADQDASWFLVMTNLDSWSRHDIRYETAVQHMTELG